MNVLKFWFKSFFTYEVSQYVKDLIKLLEKHDEWEIETYNLKHKTGMELWTSGRPHSDMNMYEPNLKFNMYERFLIRRVYDKNLEKIAYAQMRKIK